MKRLIPILASIVALVAAPRGAGAQCYACSSGYCVPAAPGQNGFYVCYDCPGEECMVEWGTNCRGVPVESVALTSARVFALDEHAAQRLFGRGASDRVMRLRVPAATCEAVVRQLAGLSGTAPEAWDLKYWQMTVAGGRFSLGASAAGTGYAFTGVPKGAGTQIQVFATSGAAARQRLAATTLRTGDILLTRIELEGRPYLMVIQSQMVPFQGDHAAADLIARQRAFKEDATAFQRGDLLALQVDTTASGLVLPQ